MQKLCMVAFNFGMPLMAAFDDSFHQVNIPTRLVVSGNMRNCQQTHFVHLFTTFLITGLPATLQSDSPVFIVQ